MAGLDPEPGWSDLAALVREERLTRGWSKTMAARRTGLSATTWRMIETGKNPTASDETLVRLAKGLGFDPLYILTMVGRIPRRTKDHGARLTASPKSRNGSVIQALESDETIDDRARTVLTELYEMVQDLVAQTR